MQCSRKIIQANERKKVWQGSKALCIGSQDQYSGIGRRLVSQGIGLVGAGDREDYRNMKVQFVILGAGEKWLEFR
jgi:hypothetical protein